MSTRMKLLENALTAIRDAKPADAHYSASAAVVYYQRQAATALERANALPQPEDYARAFAERTTQYTRCADECITLTNERDALRAQLARLVRAVDRASANFADGLADEARAVIAGTRPPSA